VRNNFLNRLERLGLGELNPVSQTRPEELDSAARYACFSILRAYRLDDQPASRTQPNTAQAVLTGYVGFNEAKYQADSKGSVERPPERPVTATAEPAGQNDLVRRAEQAVEQAYREVGLGQTIEELFSDD
jgi:hypothetical protein